jgi:peptidyl-prolyl cis-trans isomerase C
MKSLAPALRATVLAATLLPAWALAQNIAVVNGKTVPKARAMALVQQAERSGQKVPPEMMGRVNDEVVMREIFAQEAERRGMANSPDFAQQWALARQSLLIRELFEDYRKKNAIAEGDVKVEYEKFKAQNTGTEYRARHILVDKEEEAKKLIAEIKAGAKFDELAKKHSKDTGSGANGGDLDFAKPEGYVPEFGKAMTALKKGEMTAEPVKTQFGFHIIRLEDQRDAQFPAYDDVKGQLRQRMEQTKLQQYQEELRKAAKTDYKFSQK